MLSYTEHGKFPATTQEQSPRARDEKVMTIPIRREFLATFRLTSGSWQGSKRNGRGGGVTAIPGRRARIARRAIPVRFCDMNFASDNTAPVAPAILDVIVKALIEIGRLQVVEFLLNNHLVDLTGHHDRDIGLGIEPFEPTV